MIWAKDIDAQFDEMKNSSQIYHDECVKAGVQAGMSKRDAVIAINDWICDRIDYDYTYKNGDGVEALKTGVGTCAAYSKIMQGMCAEAGIPCLRVIGTGTTSDGTGSHAWNQVKLGDTWYYVDVCWNDTGGVRTNYLLSAVLWPNHYEEYTTCE